MFSWDIPPIVWLYRPTKPVSDWLILYLRHRSFVKPMGILRLTKHLKSRCWCIENRQENNPILWLAGRGHPRLWIMGWLVDDIWTVSVKTREKSVSHVRLLSPARQREALVSGQWLTGQARPGYDGHFTHFLHQPGAPLVIMPADRN